MNYWWYVIILLIVVTIVSGIIHMIIDRRSRHYDTLFFATSFTSGLIVLIVGIVAIGLTVEAPKDVRQFKLYKEYVESIEETGGFADVALTTTKIELNSWLMNAKAKKTTYGNWSFYPSEVLEIEPIQ